MLLKLNIKYKSTHRHNIVRIKLCELVRLCRKFKEINIGKEKEQTKLYVWMHEPFYQSYIYTKIIILNNLKGRTKFSDLITSRVEIKVKTVYVVYKKQKHFDYMIKIN